MTQKRKLKLHNLPMYYGFVIPKVRIVNLVPLVLPLISRIQADTVAPVVKMSSTIRT